MRRDFAASVSHEIKTPLTAIKGFVETLSTGDLDDREEIRRFLNDHRQTRQPARHHHRGTDAAVAYRTR
jgi:signal transduction histidine kinase